MPGSPLNGTQAPSITTMTTDIDTALGHLSSSLFQLPASQLGLSACKSGGRRRGRRQGEHRGRQNPFPCASAMEGLVWVQPVQFPPVDTLYPSSTYYCNPTCTDGKIEWKYWNLNPNLLVSFPAPSSTCTASCCGFLAPPGALTVITAVTRGRCPETRPPGSPGRKVLMSRVGISSPPSLSQDHAVLGSAGVSGNGERWTERGGQATEFCSEISSFCSPLVHLPGPWVPGAVP